MTVHAVFLRGINVGKTKRIAMADLRAWLENAGFADVRTYVQSGNIVLADAASSAKVEQRVAEAIREHSGYEVAVVARTRAQLAKVVARDPFAEVADDPSRYFVAFCTSAPAAAPLRELLAADVEADLLAAEGREIYGWCPDGLQDGPAAKLLARAKLGTDATVRNWRTVAKVLEMCDDG